MNVIQVPRRFVTSDWGGTETVILQTCRQLRKASIHTEIYTTSALSLPGDDAIDGVPIKRVPYFYPYWGLSPEAKRQLDLKGGNLFSFQMLKALKNYKPLDLIHLHTGKRFGGIGRYIALKRKIPYVISLHGGVFDVSPQEAARWTEPTQHAFEWGKILGAWVGARKVLDDAQTIICVGQREQKEVQKRFPRKRVVHLPNGVDPERFEKGDGAAFRKKWKIDGNAYLLINVGRIDPQKNQKFLIEAFENIRSLKPNAHMLFVGHVTNDPYYSELKRLIHEKKYEDWITMIPGFDAEGSDLVDAYHAADLFVLPSVHEPFGIVILEAWACGLPVLASRVGGIPSFVESGKDALLFSPDSREDFLKNLRDIILNENLKNELVANARRKVEAEYTWEKVTQKLIGIYQETLQAYHQQPL
ncbi:MAG: glycosyltransferase family 4 protein [Candidatus Omnitrophica bacterium]|nr:glycosyltransferase family 4 protein [Candidatus Omnitrophota bacterium]